MAYNIYRHLSRKQEITIVDRLMMLASIIQPFSSIPQIYKIYSAHSAADVSLWTWFGFMILGLAFLLYGIAHKLKPLIVNQFIWFTFDFLIVLGVYLYG